MKRHLGATMIEFALVLILFLTIMLGIVDFARMLWTWNAASEATRWGARTAVVCERNSAAVLASMQQYLPQLKAANVIVDWYRWDSDSKTYAVSTTCDHLNCAGVSVQITQLNYQWLGPIAYGMQSTFSMPGFSTFLPREIMGRDPDSVSVCTAP